MIDEQLITLLPSKKVRTCFDLPQRLVEHGELLVEPPCVGCQRVHLCTNLNRSGLCPTKGRSQRTCHSPPLISLTNVPSVRISLMPCSLPSDDPTRAMARRMSSPVRSAIPPR